MESSSNVIVLSEINDKYLYIIYAVLKYNMALKYHLFTINLCLFLYLYTVIDFILVLSSTQRQFSFIIINPP